MALFHSKGSGTLEVPSSQLERSQLRQLIKKAAHGNLTAFTQLSSQYADLLSEYFYLLGYSNPVDRLFEIQKLLADAWRYASYVRRVSDFERLLQILLEKRNALSPLNLGEPHECLGQLSHLERFLLVARTFEAWSYKSIRLSLRKKKSEVSTDLMQLKAKLIGFRISMLQTQQQIQVLRLSELLEGQVNAKKLRGIENEIAGNYHVLHYKADWLAYRCELVELRQEMLLSSEEKNELKERLSVHLKQAPTERPKLSDSIINQFSFVRLPASAS